MSSERRQVPSGVIFDFDGTLVTSTIDFAAMREAVLAKIESYGLPDNVIDPKASSASNIIAAWNHLSMILDEGGMLEFERRIESVSSMIEMQNVWKTKEVPGTTEALCDLHFKGYRTGILTRGSRRYVDAALRASGIPFERGHMVCRDDYPLIEAKPNPISLMRTAQLIGLVPEQCIYVGDHGMDYDCAASIGMPFIGVLSGHNNRDRWNGRDLSMIVDDITKIPDLLNHLKGS